MNDSAHLRLCSYINSQLTSAWNMAADSASYTETPNQYLCKTLKISLETNPQTKSELELFAKEGMKQLLSNTMLLRENGIPTVSREILDDVGSVVNTAGFYYGYKQYDLHIDAKWNDGVGKWKGNNGVWYMEKVEGKRGFWGNQYTGSRKNIIAESEKYSKLGNKLFWIGTLISAVQGGIALADGNTANAVKAGVDIVVGIIATWGGPVGWTIGGISLFLDLVGTFDQPHFHNRSPYHNNPHIQLRDKTYVKSPMLLPYTYPRIQIPQKSNAVFRQGY